MTRYFVTHQTATIHCSTVTVNMTTSTAQHLWLLWTTKEPFIRPRPFRNQESTRPHQNNFSLQIMGDVEQQEPGNTTQHTFVLPWPYTATRLFFYSINQGTGKIKASRSPIFAYDISPQILFEETWSISGKPDLPWLHPGTPPAPFPYTGGGSLILRNSIDRSDALHLDLVALLGDSPSVLCNLFLRVKIGNFQLGLPTDDAQGSVLIVYAGSAGSPANRDGRFTLGQDPCVVSDGNYTYPASLNSTVGFPLSPMLLELPDICGNPDDPPPPAAYASELRLIASSSGPLNPQREWFFTYGPVQIGTTSGVMTDVSGQWRHKRIAPFIP